MIWFEIIPEEQVSPAQRWAAELAQKEAKTRLGVSVPIRWVRPETCCWATTHYSPEYVQFRELFDGLAQMDGDDIAVYIRVGLSARRTGEVVAHELKHVRQFMNQGPLTGDPDRRAREEEATRFSYVAMCRPNRTLQFLDWSTAAAQRDYERRASEAS